MIAKIITHADTRDDTIAQLREACADVEAFPVKTNAGFLVRCLDDEAFAAGDVDTSLIAARGDALLRRPPPSTDAAAYAAARFMGQTQTDERTPWTSLGGFRINAPAQLKVRMRIGADAFETTPAEPGVYPSDGSIDAIGVGHSIVVFEDGEAYEFTLDMGAHADGEAAAGDGAILSPMPGKIVSVAAKAGAKLKKGDPILVLEAMKMEHTLTAPFDGVVAELNASAGAQVSEGVVLAKLEKQ